MMSKKKIFTDGLIFNNPIFVQVLGMCPVLAVTTSATNGLGMGLATTAVLLASNTVISLLRKFIPSKIRIPAFIVVIATFVTIVEMLLQAYIESLYSALGLFLPLIVVNCVILGRAESFASKNSVDNSIIDGIGMGLGFTLGLTILGIVRELIGAGSVFGTQVMWSSYEPFGIMTQAPGAFLGLGILLAIFGSITTKKNNA